MLLFVLAYLGGVLTIISPCILPVLPFVFARADKPFVRSGLPMLAGMVLTFALVASLAAVGGGWAVRANQYGRIVALVLLAGFGLTLLLPGLADRLTRPVVALGDRLTRSIDGGSQSGGASVLASAVLGVATGLLWAPCAGPVLGLILTGAALGGASVQTWLLLVAFAAGAATSLAVALLVGGKAFAAMKRSLGVTEWIRRGVGAIILVAVAAIALGLDTGLLTRLSLSGGSSGLEQGLVDRLVSRQAPRSPAGPGEGSSGLPVEALSPSLDGATTWLNSPPLTLEQLKGKVVVVDFWTYSCINCLRSIPYVRAWADKYKDQGLVLIGVHAPEFAFEKDVGNVRRAVSDLGVTYPVALDNDRRIWRAFENHYWPAHYFIDAQGRVRHHHYGEGDYAQSERVIQQLLAEAGRGQAGKGVVDVRAQGAQMASDGRDVASPETYLGYDRAENFASPGGALPDKPKTYAAAKLDLNDWALTGRWTVGAEAARQEAGGGTIRFRFHARDLHLVLGPGPDGRPVRYRVTIDGAAPGQDHGADTDAAGEGVVTSQRLYQLVRQKGAVKDRTFEIQFLTPGVSAYAFTFG